MLNLMPGFVVPDSAFKPNLALHIMDFSSCRNYWGRGQNDMLATPIFSWGRLPHPLPQDRRLWSHLLAISSYLHVVYSLKYIEILIETKTRPLSLPRTSLVWAVNTPSFEERSNAPPPPPDLSINKIRPW